MIYLISGSRTFHDRSKVRYTMQETLRIGDTLIHGGATGVDTWASERATDFQITTVKVTPEWGKLGKVAGVIRNITMAEMAIGAAEEFNTLLKALIFWDGQSKGTQHMIQQCLMMRIHMEVFF